MTTTKKPFILQLTPEHQSQVAGAFDFFNISKDQAEPLKRICIKKIRMMISHLLNECLDYKALSGKKVQSKTVAAAIQDRVSRLRGEYTGETKRRRDCPLALILLGIQIELRSDSRNGPYQLSGGHGKAGRYLTGAAFLESKYISDVPCIWAQADSCQTAGDQTVNEFIDFLRAQPENKLLVRFATGGPASMDAIKRVILSIRNPAGNNWQDLSLFNSGMPQAMKCAHRMIHEMLKKYGVENPSCGDIQKVADEGRFSSMMNQHAATCDVRHYKTDEPERITEDRLRGRLTDLGLTVESGKIDRGRLSGMKPDLRVGNGSQWVQLQDISGLVVEVKAKGKLELAPVEWVRVSQYRYEMPEDEILVLYAPKGDSGKSLTDSSDAPPAIEQIKKSKPDIHGRPCFNFFDDHEQCIEFICGIFGMTYKDPAAHNPSPTLQRVLYAEDDTSQRVDDLEQTVKRIEEKLDMLIQTKPVE